MAWVNSRLQRLILSGIHCAPFLDYRKVFAASSTDLCLILSRQPYVWGNPEI